MSERDTVKLVIMTTGEHIIGFVKNENSEHMGEPAIEVEQPVSLVPNPQKPGSMVFMPYLQFSEEETAPFPKRDVRHILTPVSELVESYSEKFGSGIVVPNNGGLQLV